MEPQDLRIGNPDRDRTAQLLRTAGEEGRLSTDEVAERIAQLPQLLTYRDLDQLLADLPVPPPSSQVGGALPGVGPMTVAPTMHEITPLQAATSPQPLRLEGGMGREVRSGRWVLPDRIHLEGGLGAVVMDCLQATCPHPVVHISVSGTAGSIVVVVPDGWAATINDVRRSMGSAKSKVADIPTPGCPLLVFAGSMGMGSMVVRHANWWDRRRQRRLLKREQKLALTSGWAEQNNEIENPKSLR